MRSKAPLAMMEQMVMLLVFALAAALCLQAFVKSDQMSKGMEARDRAMTLCQNAAEALRASKGDFAWTKGQLSPENVATAGSTEDALLIMYGGDWKIAAPTTGNVYPFYNLRASRVDSGVPGLGKAEVWVQVQDDESGEDLFRLEVAWQEEVSSHG